MTTIKKETKETRNGLYDRLTVIDNDTVSLVVDIDYGDKNKVAQITMRDLIDRYNEPVMFSKSKRGLEKMANEIKSMEVLSWKIISELFTKYNINTHYYCAVD